MIAASGFIDAARDRGFGLFTGVPCSYLTPLIDTVIATPQLRYVGAANEGEAVAVASGFALGGQRAVVLLQNSGLGNAVSPLTSLNHPFRLPVLLLVTLRGEPGGAPDEPQHALMGAITLRLLDLMQVSWERLPSEPTAVAAVLDRAVDRLDREQLPHALVVSKGSFAPAPRSSPPAPAPPAVAGPEVPRAVAARAEILAAVQASAAPGDVLVASTGYTGRQLFALDDRPGQLYMVGSMGCASSLGLGLALARPRRRVIVLDGDGAALMRLGALATLGHELPPNLTHVLLDNGVHESTGGQATVSSTVSFPGLAAAAGYPRVRSVATAAEVAAELELRAPELTLLHVPILPGVPTDLPRPGMSPAEVAVRLRRFLAEEQPTAGEGGAG